MTHRVGELHLEQAGRDIENTLLGIGLLATYTNGVDEVGLTTARWTINKEGVKGALTRMLSDGEADSTRQFI